MSLFDDDDLIRNAAEIENAADDYEHFIKETNSAPQKKKPSAASSSAGCGSVLALAVGIILLIAFFM